MLYFNPKKTHTLFLLFAVGLLMPGLPAPAADLYGNADCWTAVPVDLNSTRDVLADSPLPISVFRIEIPSPGVLVSELSGSSPTPFVELSDESCGPLRAQDVTYVERFPGRSVVKVRSPGTYHLRVPMNRTAEPDSYRLYIGFSKAVPFLASPSPAKEIEEWEDDDEGLIDSPHLVAWQQTGAVDKEIEEWEDDDEGLTAGTPTPCVASALGAGEQLLTVGEPGILALDGAGSDLTAVLEPLEATILDPAMFGPSSEILTRIEPGTYSLRWAVPAEAEGFCGPTVSFYPICDLVNADDHGDSMACASEISIGGETSGEIGAIDADVFSFVLESHAFVVFQTSGETDIHLAVLDEAGHLLRTDDDGGDGWSSRIETELCPGRYFLRVTGIGDSDGVYVLETSLDPS